MVTSTGSGAREHLGLSPSLIISQLLHNPGRVPNLSWALGSFIKKMEWEYLLYIVVKTCVSIMHAKSVLHMVDMQYMEPQLFWRKQNKQLSSVHIPSRHQFAQYLKHTRAGEW